MLKQFKNRKEEGFTIIEVLIVLAIAGLILLVVFLAVPALQRNQRNTGRQSDASRITAAANDFLSNGNGTVPSSVADGTTILQSAGALSNLSVTGGLTINGKADASLKVPAAASATCAATTPVNDTFTICKGAAVSFTMPATPTNHAILATAAQCNGAGTIQTGSSREMALVYTKEISGGFTYACVNI